MYFKVELLSLGLGSIPSKETHKITSLWALKIIRFAFWCFISAWGKIIIPQAISFILRLNGIKSLRNANKHVHNGTSMQRGCYLLREQGCWLPLASSNSPISHLQLYACQKALDSESSLGPMGCFCGLAVPCFLRCVDMGGLGCNPHSGTSECETEDLFYILCNVAWGLRMLDSRIVLEDWVGHKARWCILVSSAHWVD